MLAAEGTGEERGERLEGKEGDCMVLFDELEQSGLMSVQPMWQCLTTTTTILMISMTAVNVLRKARAFVCLQRGMSAKSNVTPGS